MSPSSASAGNSPPAVRPPLDEENSVRTTLPFGFLITTPVVSATARSVFALSRTVGEAFTEVLSAAPP